MSKLSKEEEAVLKKMKKDNAQVMKGAPKVNPKAKLPEKFTSFPVGMPDAAPAPTAAPARSKKGK